MWRCPQSFLNLSLSALLLVLTLAGAPVRAREPSAAARRDVMVPDAKTCFGRGLRLYEARSYDAAIAEFDRGYAIDPRREFLYARGQAQRMKGDCRGAVVSYEQFLRTSPLPRQEAPAHAQLDRCRAELAAADAAERSAETVVDPVPAVPAVAPAIERDPDLSPAPPTSPRPLLAAGPTTDATAHRAAPVTGATVANVEHPRSSSAAPLYRRWWFWTAVGAVALAATGVALATTGAFARTQDAPCPKDRECLQP